MPKFLIIGALFAMLAVILGAMGAHLLKEALDTKSLMVFQTASTYQMYHSLAMILVALSIPYTHNKRLLNIAAWLFIAGIILFSGSLYGLSFLQIKFLGMITPLGGMCFILAWFLYAASFLFSLKEADK